MASKNKLSLNCSKTSFNIFNKQPNKTCDYEFKLNLYNISIQSVNFIKYLGVFIGSKLSWSKHMDYLIFSLLGAWHCFLDCMDTEVGQNNGNMLKIETNFNMV